MKHIVNQCIGIDQGETVLFSDFEDGGEMWTGQGPRQKTVSVIFNEVFKEPPSVQAGLSMWDMDSANNLRADLSVGEITETGFQLVFKTWGDTRVARVRVRWMAIGTVQNDDDWELY